MFSMMRYDTILCDVLSHPFIVSTFVAKYVFSHVAHFNGKMVLLLSFYLLAENMLVSNCVISHSPTAPIWYVHLRTWGCTDINGDTS